MFGTVRRPSASFAASHWGSEMAQRFDGPVTVNEASAQRQTVVEGGSIFVGKAKTPGDRLPGFPGHDLNPDEPSGDADAIPAAQLVVGDLGVTGGITVRNKKDQPAISFNGATGLASFGTPQG